MLKKWSSLPYPLSYYKSVGFYFDFALTKDNYFNDSGKHNKCIMHSYLINLAYRLFSTCISYAWWGDCWVGWHQVSVAVTIWYIVALYFKFTSWWCAFSMGKGRIRYSSEVYDLTLRRILQAGVDLPMSQLWLQRSWCQIGGKMIRAVRSTLFRPFVH